MRTIITPEHKETPIEERFKFIKGRKYFMMDAKLNWKEVGQGRYNWLLSQGYTVKYNDK